MSDLQLSVETVIEVQPSEVARQLILEIAKESGRLEDYQDYRFGSAYYVELPRYINKLVEAGELDQARQDLRICFSDGISDELWREMRNGN